MSFSDWRRDDGEGRGVEGKYILWGVTGAEISRLDDLPKAMETQFDRSGLLEAQLHREP